MFLQSLAHRLKGFLEKANNLSDVASAAQARTNLGVSATADVLLKANNLSDVADASTAAQNLGALEAANDLSDVTNAATALNNLGVTRDISIKVFDDETAVETGDGKKYWRLPDSLTGWFLGAITLKHYDGTDTGATLFQVYDMTQSQDVLSTGVSVDDGENDSKDAATPAVIDADYNEVTANGTVYRFDCDTAGTDRTGAEICLTFYPVQTVS